MGTLRFPARSTRTPRCTPRYPLPLTRLTMPAARGLTAILFWCAAACFVFSLRSTPIGSARKAYRRPPTRTPSSRSCSTSRITFSEPITVSDAASLIDYSDAHFMRLFRRETGFTFGEYLSDYRLRYASYLLRGAPGLCRCHRLPVRVRQLLLFYPALPPQIRNVPEGNTAPTGARVQKARKLRLYTTRTSLLK